LFFWLFTEELSTDKFGKTKLKALTARRRNFKIKTIGKGED